MVTSILVFNKDVKAAHKLLLHSTWGTLRKHLHYICTEFYSTFTHYWCL